MTVSDDTLPPVLGVVGSTGGVGASMFTAALSAACARGVLVDLDVFGGGIDVLLGIEASPGARWSSVQVDGGALDPVDLARGLPRWRGVSVLAADGVQPSAVAIDAVVDAGRRLGPVILDLGRRGCHGCLDALRLCTLVVIVAEARCRGIAGARALARAIGDGVAVGLLTRRGEVDAIEVARVVGLPLLASLGPVPRGQADRRLLRVPRAMQRAAAVVLAGTR